MDLEMTGLDPAKDVIVEIATIVTDDQLEIVAEGPDLVVHQPDGALAVMEPVVLEMHTARGLLPLIQPPTTTLQHPAAATFPLCGNSIGTDRRFLAIHLPEMEEHLHYRSVDVSTIKELTRRWYPGALEATPRKATAHRALDDIRESIDELRWYRDHVFKPAGPPDPAVK